MSRYFTEAELRCRCRRPECEAPAPSPALLAMLDRVRELVGGPVGVTSGSRCPYWNKRKGGVGGSEHETGEGADVMANTSAHRYKILQAAFALGVGRIGVGRDFVHLGVSPTHAAQVCWHYYPAPK